MNARPRIVRTAAAVPAVLLLLLMSGCSHYHIGIPLVPGLSLGLGATKDGNFSVGLNTGFGPLGAGVAVNNGGQVSGSAGVGVGVGPVATGISKGAVLYDPKAGTAAPVGAATPTATAAATTTAAPAAGTVATAAPTAPVAPLPPARTATRVITPTAAAPLVKITRPPPEPQAPAMNVSYRTPAAAASTVSTAAVRDAGTPGHPIAP